MGVPGPSGELIIHPVPHRHCPLLRTSEGRLKTPCESQPSLSGTQRESTGRQRESQDDVVPTQKGTAKGGDRPFHYREPRKEVSVHRATPPLPSLCFSGLGPCKGVAQGTGAHPHRLKDTQVPPGFIVFLSGQRQQPAEAEHETASRCSSSAETPTEPANGQTDTLLLLAPRMLKVRGE